MAVRPLAGSQGHEHEEYDGTHHGGRYPQIAVRRGGSKVPVERESTLSDAGKVVLALLSQLLCDCPHLASSNRVGFLQGMGCARRQLQGSCYKQQPSQGWLHCWKRHELSGSSISGIGYGG